MNRWSMRRGERSTRSAGQQLMGQQLMGQRLMENDRRGNGNRLPPIQTANLAPGVFYAGSSNAVWNSTTARIETRPSAAIGKTFRSRQLC